jgi:hypothetical protein
MMAPNIQQVPGIQRRSFGDFVVTALNDGFIKLPPEAVRGIAATDSAAQFAEVAAQDYARWLLRFSHSRLS